LFDRDRTRIDAADIAAILADRSFVVQIALAMVGDPGRGKGEVGRGRRLAGQLPGEQDVAVFEHEVPMLATIQSVM